ncbi:hypothetical protein BD309DRAFT_968480 [Dichomitus squalens]|nr:hypothetical protein BD309DRAFT_968480 [Dichomitus squalens]
MSQSSKLTSARNSYAASVIAGVTYGAYAVLAAICIHFLLKRRSNTRSQKIILAYTILMLAMTTLYYVSGCVWAEVEFVESTMNIDVYDLQTNSRLSVLKDTAYVINIYLADSLLIYRVWVVWGGAILVVIIPCLLWCGTVSTGIGLLWACSRPTASLVESSIINWQTSFYSCTVSHNIVCTIFIAGRLWYHHRKTRNLRTSAAWSYSSIIAVVIESAALYSLAGIIYIPLVVRMLPAQFAVTAVIGSITSIAPNLIILRMALGTAVSVETADPSMAFKLSTLHSKPTTGLSQVTGTTAANQSFSGSRSVIPISGSGGAWASDIKPSGLNSMTDKDSMV